MNRCTQLDEILHEHVPRQPHRTQRISRSQVKVEGHRTGLSDFQPLQDVAEKLVDTIAHEPLHSAWWHFAWTCTLTTARTLLNFKVIGQKSRSFFVAGLKFAKLSSPNVEKIVAHGAVFRLSIAHHHKLLVLVTNTSCLLSRSTVNKIIKPLSRLSTVHGKNTQKPMWPWPLTYDLAT